MSFVGEVTGVFGLLGKAWNLLRDRLDPARAQAKRLIETFEAYGIARQQIPRVLPPELKLPNANFSTPDKLKDKVTPELLDWAADYLAINRSWLDGVASQPHPVMDHASDTAGYRTWLVQRLVEAPNADHSLSVWKAHGQPISGGQESLFLIYQEASEGLDGIELNRCWLLSDGWHLDHPRCLHLMVAVVAMARSLGIPVRGMDVEMEALEQVATGEKLIPQAKFRIKGMWHPEDLIEPLPGQDTAWRQALWKAARAHLTDAEIRSQIAETSNHTS